MHRSARHAVARVRSTSLGAALLLLGYMTIGVAPFAAAAPVSCTVSSGALTVALRGNNATISGAMATTAGAKITVTTGLGCNATYDDVTSLTVDGASNAAEVVTFQGASTDNADDTGPGSTDATYWDELFQSNNIRLALGSGPDDEVVLEGSALTPDKIDAQAFAFAYDGTDTVTVYGFGGEDEISGAPGIDNHLDGGGDADVIHGSTGDDVIFGGVDVAVDTMTGGDGDDIFDESFASTDDDIIDGEGDDDTVDYGARSNAVTVDLTTGHGGESGEDDTLTSIENAITGSGDDTLTGNSAANVFDGGTGDDIIDGNGSPYDVMDYGTRTNAVTVTLGDGGAETVGNGESGEDDSITAIEGVIGGSGNDVLTGNDGSNLLQGGSGDDTLEGGDDVDTLEGGDGSDVFVEGDDANDDADVLVGGTGSDTADYLGRSTSVIVDLTNDVGDVFDGVENVNGTEYGDSITGTSGVNTLLGNGGSDTIDALGGKDRLVGGLGVDYLLAGSGDDQLDGTKDGSVDFLDGGDQIKGDKCTIEGTAEKNAANSCETFAGVKKTRP